MLKSKRVWISDRASLFSTRFGSTENNAEIRTICSDFRQKISSEIWTIRFERSDFGIIGILMLWMPKSERSKIRTSLFERSIVWISALFGFQMFGFQHSTVRSSDFGIPLNCYNEQASFESKHSGQIWFKLSSLDTFCLLSLKTKVLSSSIFAKLRILALKF